MLGPAAFEMGDTVYGRSSDDYQLGAYGNYLATSNAVYACSSLRADMLSSLPLRLSADPARRRRK